MKSLLYYVMQKAISEARKAWDNSGRKTVSHFSWNCTKDIADMAAKKSGGNFNFF